jgi:uncharacterized protein YndB with AHSA1/START domain
MKVIELRVSRTIAARVERVFAVWMDPASPGGPWYGADKVIVEVKVDGLFYLAMAGQGKVWPHFGRFVRIEQPRMVEFTWMSEGTQGLESTVEVTFEGRGDETEVTLRHAGVPDDEMGRKHAEGWGWVLSQLAEQFK